MARILQVCNTDFYLNRFLAPLVLELAARGHAVDCAFEGTSPDARITAAGVRTFPIPFPKKGSPFGFVSAIQRMRKLIRQGSYDCVNSHNRNASLVARVAAWLERVPANIYTAHGFYFHDGQPGWMREVTVWLEAALARITDFTLSQSREDVEYVVRRRIIPRERIQHIGNGIDTKRFHPRPGRKAEFEAKLGLAPSPFRIATTGRIVAGKGFEDLVTAFARFAAKAPDSALLMIGGNIAQDINATQRELVQRIASLGVQSKVTITGIVNNVHEYLAAADVFVLPSYREGVPRSLMEAMSAGVACIATRIRGCREVLGDGVTGFLYRPGDVDALATLLERYWKDPLARARISAAAGSKGADEFSEQQYVERQVAAIEHFLGADGVPLRYHPRG
jgi:glycosyltransferase involved in cell wall biosynthesis